MQISDLARQYIKSTTSKGGAKETRGVEKLVSSIRDLTAGNVFEGTVNSVKNGQVVLGLSNGAELMARLDAGLQLVPGQSMFFQVKSNTGDTIAIRPYTVDGAGVNLTLLNALKAANLPAAEKYLNMANVMMHEKMPIDKNSLTQMARILMANPEMSVNTLVQMKKLDLPITSEMVAQFENYADDNSAVHKALDSFISELPSTMAGKELPLEQLKILDSQILQILADGMDAVQADMGTQTDASANIAMHTGTSATDASRVLTNVSGNAEMNTGTVSADVAGNAGMSTGTVSTDVSENAGMNTGTVSADVSENPAVSTGTAVENTDGVLTNSTVNPEKQAAEMLTKIDHSSKNAVVRMLNGMFGDIGITSEDSPAQIMQKLSRHIMDSQQISKDTLMQLFSSKEMRQFVKDVFDSQMYLAPGDVADADKIKHLYERLEGKTQSIANLLNSVGLQQTSLAQTIADVHANVDFMNQLNQTFTYVQVPLKMSGQSASGQLYVYTKKRELNDPEKELSAFLHLDLDHLGSTDISVRLHRKEVDTRFYMDNDASFHLIRQYMPQLEERLRLKGYNCRIYVENEGKQVDFVEDFLKKDVPSTAQLHRYSFDVRA